jgi:hypothetical protein
MPIVNDQTFADNFDPGNPPPTFPYTATVVPLELNDVDDNGIIDANGDIVNGSPVTAVYNGDVVVIGGVSITGATIYTADGGRYFTPTDDTVLVDSIIDSVTFVPDSTLLTIPDLGPACLVEGTLVSTENGPMLIENIAVGDRILTKDRGLQELRWIGKRTVEGMGDFAPICFAKGSFGNDRDLRVSPEHRMLVEGWKCELLFGEPEALCAAKHLVAHSDDVYVRPCETVTYYHLMFDAHEIIYAEGAQTESFFMGTEVAKKDRETYLELMKLFPERAEKAVMDSVLSARMLLKPHEVASLQTL